MLWRPLALIAALFWPVLIPQALPGPKVEAAARACPIEDLTPTLERAAGGVPKTILAWADYSPALLYRTRHRVLSIPNHRPQPGFRVTYEVLVAEPGPNVHAELRRRGIDWILLCPSAPERSLFAHDNHHTLYQHLIEDQPPAWLAPVELPEDVRDEARLFAVRQLAPPSAATTARR